MISLCRASNIQTIEALNDLQGPARKRLGVVGNAMIPMAQKWVEARNAAVGSENADRIRELEAQVKALLAAPGGTILENKVPPEVDPGDAYHDKSDQERKDKIGRAHV